MRTEFPKLLTLSLKKNLQLGARMEVCTVEFSTYDQLRKKTTESITVTRLSGESRVANRPQWDKFTGSVQGKYAVVFDFWAFESFWPHDLVESFHNRNRHDILCLLDALKLFFPGVIFTDIDHAVDILSQYTKTTIDPNGDSTFTLFEMLSRYAAGLELKSLQDSSTLLSPEFPAIAEWLSRLRHVSVPQIETSYRLPDNLTDSDLVSRSQYSFDDESLKRIFSYEGNANEVLENYEERPEQLKYARHFMKALKSDEYLLAEAGTGTGKSLAYLVPSLLHQQEYGQKVVVSTHTKNLQHQLFYKDLVQAERMLGKRVRGLLLKGRANYICLLRLSIARAAAARKYDAEQLADLGAVLLWKDITQSGDLAELRGLDTKVKRDIMCDAAFCPASNCSYYRECFFFRVRLAVPKADVVITNHALFFSDAVSEAEIFKSPGVVIFDEAHHIEKVATDSLTGELSRSTVGTVFEPLESQDPQIPDPLSSITGYATRLAESDSDRQRINDISGEIREHVADCKKGIAYLFQVIEGFVRENKLVPKSYSRRERILPGHRLMGQMESAMTSLHDKLRQIEKRISQLLEVVPSGEKNDEMPVDLESVVSVARSLREYVFSLGNFIEVDDYGFVRWLEVTPTGWLSLKIAPVEIGEIMERLIYERHERVLFTSATMTVDRDFAFMEQRLGLDRLPEEKKRRAIFGSYFDYTSQAKFVCAAYLPSPRSDFYQRKLSQFLRSVFGRVDKNTLVLFTSYSSLHQVLNDLGGKFPRIVAQETTDSAERALFEFRQMKPAILFGTESFWHGVDLPGEELELLIITRLPFSVPGDPIDSARMELVEQKGENSFANYSLPAAVLRFKQGFGRLIRTSYDKGVVIVTDNRLVKSNFGQTFLNSVPAGIEIATSPEDIDKSLEFLE